MQLLLVVNLCLTQYEAIKSLWLDDESNVSPKSGKFKGILEPFLNYRDFPGGRTSGIRFSSQETETLTEQKETEPRACDSWWYFCNLDSAVLRTTLPGLYHQYIP